MIVFVHIPKTGGFTLNKLMLERLGNRAWVFNSESELDGRASTANDSNVIDCLYLSGHFRFPHVKEQISRRTTTTKPRYVTLLREPVERAFSFYTFLLRYTTAIPSVSKIIAGKDFEYFLEAFYEHGAWHLRDAQAWLLSGERSAKAAIQVIEAEMSLVGINEDYKRFYDGLKEFGELPLPDDIAPFTSNAAPRGSDASVLAGGKPDDWRNYVSPSARKRLEIINAADFELYDYFVKEHNGFLRKLR